jgi:general secretion pathway protein I
MMNPSSRKTGNSSRGFTLLEVLIALAIVAMSVGALLGTVTSSASNVIYLKDKTLAEWVALNRLTEVRIDKAMPTKGRRKGSTTMAGMRWEWEEEVTDLPFQGMLRIEVSSHSTGETVDDSRPTEKPTAQALSPSTSSGTSTATTNWTSTVTGVVSSSRSDRLTPVAAPIVGNLQSRTPGNPNNPNVQPGTPNPPGLAPTPGTPGTNPPNPAPNPPPAPAPRDR